MSAAACEDLVLLAHGSPDPRHRAGVGRLARGVGRLAGTRRVHTAYLDHHPPTPLDVARNAERGLAVVPVLLTPAYHARVDVPRAVADMAVVANGGVRATPALGPHPMLVDAAEELLGAAGVGADRGTGVVLFAAGSSDSAAVTSITDTLREHPPAEAWGPWRVAALDGGLAVGAVAAQLLPQVRRVVAVAFVVAEGVLRDRQAAACASAGIGLVHGALSDTEALARLALARVDSS